MFQDPGRLQPLRGGMDGAQRESAALAERLIEAWRSAGCDIMHQEAVARLYSEADL